MLSCKYVRTFLLLVAVGMLATAVAIAEGVAFSTHAPARALQCSLAQACCSSPGEEAASSLRLFKKPFYPPLERFAQRRQLLVKSLPCMDTSSSSEAAPPVVCPECSCDDIAARLLVLEREQRLLVQSVARLERVMRELLQELEASDDIVLLERLACNSMVYNIELTSKRDLRLLRSTLLKIISKFV